MDKKDIGFYLRIENTKRIFDFLQEIWRQKWKGDVFQSEEDSLADVHDLLDGVLNGEEMPYHNPFTDFVKFWNNYFSENRIRSKSDGAIKEELTKLYQYFFKIKYLYDGETFDFDKAPYIYEDICVLMCTLMKYNMCYLVCHRENERPVIIAQSGYYAEYFNTLEEEEQNGCETILDAVSIERYIERSGDEKACETPIAGIYWFGKKTENGNGKNEARKDGQKMSAEKCSDVLLLKLRAGEHGKNLEQRSFFVLFQGVNDLKKTSWKLEDIFYHLPKILLMREKLSTVLYRDCDRLIGLRHNYGYVAPIKRYSQKQDHIVKILHISDLHIKSDSDEESYIDAIVNKNVKGSVDLLAITGDVVCGQGEARNLQKNYEKAERILKKIAKGLWEGEPYSERIPHDWKKRILITTGNHDYACMNEMQIIVEGRKTRYLGPSGEKGGTMVKFAYFIEFLQRFLDLPMNKMITNDLNEVRYYKQLNLKLFLLNSTSKANPYQTNKVGINKEILMRLQKETKAENGGTLHLCLTHHAGDYELDYLADVYEFHKYKELETALIEPFKLLVKKMVEYMPDHAVDNAMEGAEGQQFKEAFKKTVQSLKKEKTDDKFFTSILYSDMQKLYHWKRSEDSEIGETDDYVIQIVNRCRDLVFTSRNDTKAYQKAINELDSDFIFSGHRHKTYVPKKISGHTINITIGMAKYAQHLFIYDRNSRKIEVRIYYQGTKGETDDASIKIESPKKGESFEWETLPVVYKKA